MTPEVLERIRKPYFTTKEGGTGLGVAVARGLVEQHGGRLEYQERCPARGPPSRIDAADEGQALRSACRTPPATEKPEPARRGRALRRA